eukprot:511632-Rhodomonas_salina.1
MQRRAETRQEILLRFHGRQGHNPLTLVTTLGSHRGSVPHKQRQGKEVESEAAEDCLGNKHCHCRRGALGYYDPTLWSYASNNANKS